MIAASAERIYDLVTDVSRMGEWRPTCVGGEWEGSGEIAPGPRFRGHSRRGPPRWSTVNEVLIADGARCFAWLTNPEIGGGATRWEYRLEGSDEGTIVSESFRLTDAQLARSRTLSGRFWSALGGLVGETARKTIAGMEDTLRRVKHAAEAE